ncbi:MAG: alcohol dehydrogenase catalytic domain-containing protein [Thermoguttaceae bacterium]
MATSLPAKNRALLLEHYDPDLLKAIGSLKVVERPLPPLRHGEVLVRIEAAPCNPSDLLLLQARYGTLKTLPSVPGWEGAGTVVQSGGGLLASWLKGRRVACSLQDDRDGTWAEYFVANATNCIPLDRRLPIDQAASLTINPLTALALLDAAARGRHRAAVHTAGASQLGRMLLAVADRPLIHVVRRKEQVDLLRSLGADHVLDSSDSDFPDKLRSICAELSATIAFDAVAGPMTGTLLGAMPPGSTVLVYGGLSGEPCGGIDPVGLLFDDKKLAGFYLGHWAKSRGLLTLLRLARKAQRLLIEKRIETRIQRRLGLDEAVDGLRHYVQHMTDGKVLIVP